MSQIVDRPAAAAVIPVMKPWLGPEEAQAAADAVASGWVAQGPRVARFETAFAERIGGGTAVAVSSCTTALHLAMVLAGVGPRDEVIVPSLSFIATANAVRYVGATPVFADVDPATLALDPEAVAAAITPSTRAVILVHQAGTPADIDAIHRICDPRGIAVVEDAACAIGSTYRGRTVGRHSEQVVFSFHPRKLLTTGEGGMLVTTNDEWGARARRLREHAMDASAAQRHTSGQVVIEHYLETGFNFRMTDIQAAVGLVQLGRLDEMLARRRQLAAVYAEVLADIPGLRMASDPEWGTTNFQSFWIHPAPGRMGRDELLARLLADGISARRGIMASHLEPAYAGHPHGPLPVTEQMAAESLILPLFHTMTEAEQEQVVASLHAHLG